MRLGYQRLLTFRNRDGGFGWYPNQNSDPFLTAYALRFLVDARKAVGVDPQSIAGAREHLVKARKADGSWDGRVARAPGSWSAETAAVIATASMVVALVEAGTPTPELAPSVGFLKSQKVTDPYVLALVVRALAKVDASDGVLGRRLLDLPLTSTTPGFTGASGEAETAAHVALALLQCGLPARNALERLAALRQPGGGWGPTATTVAAIEALSLAADPRAGEEVAVDIDVNGRATRLVVRSEALHSIDLTPYLQPGRNVVRLNPSRESSLTCSVDARAWEPWDKAPAGSALAVESTMQDRGDRAWEVSGKVSWSGTAATSMVLVEVPLPPGFVLTGSSGAERAEVFDGRAVLYLPALSPGAMCGFTVSLEARADVRATARPPVAYDYYAPSVRAEGKPAPVAVR